MNKGPRVSQTKTPEDLGEERKCLGNRLRRVTFLGGGTLFRLGKTSGDRGNEKKGRKSRAAYTEPKKTVGPTGDGKKKGIHRMVRLPKSSDNITYREG